MKKPHKYCKLKCIEQNQTGCCRDLIWGAYERNIDKNKYEIGKTNTQKIERKRKHLNFRTRIKHLTRKTICFSKQEFMHDTVIGLFINQEEFGIDIHA